MSFVSNSLTGLSIHNLSDKILWLLGQLLISVDRRSHRTQDYLYLLEVFQFLSKHLQINSEIKPITV